MQPEAAVGALRVVVLDVCKRDVGEVAFAADQDPVEALVADRADEPLRVRFATGVRTGVRTTRMPSDWKTVSKARVNFASRSRIKHEKRSSTPPIARFRACWATHAPFGLRVTPARCTRLVPISLKNST